MRHVRRLTATLIGVAIWCVATTTTAYALLPDPSQGGSSSGPGPTTPLATDTSNWKYVLIVGIAMVLTVAVVGLIASLRHSRPERPSRTLQA